MTSNKMKRMKQSGKDADELEEDNEELFAELGIFNQYNQSINQSINQSVVYLYRNNNCCSYRQYISEPVSWTARLQTRNINSCPSLYIVSQKKTSHMGFKSCIFLPVAAFLLLFLP